MDTPSLIYILLLEGNKYYVGVTTNIERRLEEHRKGEGSEWTKQHKFAHFMGTKPLTHPLDEDNEARKLMMVCGVDNVRGGSYSNVVLSPEQKATLEREITHAKNACLKCGELGHYAKNCGKDKVVMRKANKCATKCSRCGRDGHAKDKCSELTLCTSNIPICNLNYCGVCGRDNHSSGDYHTRLHKCGYKVNRDGKKNGDAAHTYCERCGWSGHSVVGCFAKKRHDGSAL